MFLILRITNDIKKEKSAKLRSIREERLRCIGISVSSFVIELRNRSDLFYTVVEKRRAIVRVSLKLPLSLSLLLLVIYE